MYNKCYLPLVSVIVPYYKASLTIEKCINSITNQTYKNLEILIINDGSKDESTSIIHSLSKNDARIKYLEHSENKGVSAARNTGIDNCTGKLIYFVDADDWLVLDAVSKLIEPFIREGAQLSTAPHFQYITKNRVLKKGYQLTKNNLFSKNDIRLYVLDYLKIPYKYIMFVHCWNKIYIRDIIIKNEIYFDTNLSQLEDTNFNFKYINFIEKICYVHSFTYYHYIEKKSDSASALSGSEENALEKSVKAFEPIFIFLKSFQLNSTKLRSLKGHHFISISIIFLIRMTRRLVKHPNLKNLKFISEWIQSDYFQKNKKFYKMQKNESFIISYFIKFNSSNLLLFSLILRVLYLKFRN